MAAAPAEIPFMPPAPQEHESPKTASAPKLSDEEQALLTALRRDRDEEVRRLAAVELGKWASRSPEATRALKITASGSSADGFPAERSAQVKEAAAIALNGQPPAPAETKRPMASAARPPAVFPTGSETARPTLAPTPQRPTRAEPPLLTTPLPTRSTVNPFRAID